MALRPSHSTSGSAKMHFSRREIKEAAVFENQSKEQLFFSKFKHAFCEKLKSKKIIPKRVVKEAHFSSSFFNFSSQPKIHAYIFSKQLTKWYGTRNYGQSDKSFS